MNIREVLSKFKPIIIIIILFLLVFSLRAQAADLTAVPDQIKGQYLDDSGLPYFSEMDSYYNFRMTQDYLDHGYLGDTKINGTNWDLHSYFPPGRVADYPPLIAIVTAFTYQLVNIFSNIPLVNVAFWIGAFIASLAVIPAYLFVRRITNDYGGITAGVLVALAPFYFSHTFAGFFDTDMFNMILPLMTVWFFVESFRSDNIRNRTIFAVLSVISLVLFSLAWQGWVYIFYLLVLSTIIYLVVSKYLFGYESFKKPGEYGSIKEWFTQQTGIFTLVVFIVLGLLLVLVTAGPSGFISTLLGPLGVTQIQESVQIASAYPNVYVSVGELQVPEALNAINNVGGLVVFVFALLGVLLLFIRLVVGKKEKAESAKEDKPARKKRTGKKRRRKKDKQKAKEKSAPRPVLTELKGPDKKNYLFYAILLVVWILGTAYTLTQGVRFAETFALPVAVSAGIFVGLLLEYVRVYVPNNKVQAGVMVIVIAAAVFTPISTTYAISQSVVPGTDDSMVNSLKWIKDNTPQDTVITSWWDFGHLFTALADRPVTFDGSTQNNLRAFWVGHALSTNNESLSAGILRMLSTSGDDGPNTVEVYTNNTGKSVEILNEILGIDKESATNILTTKHGFNAEQAQNITQYTHPDNPRSSLLITSSDMVGKASWWSYFGNWDFQANNSTGYGYEQGQAMVIPNNETGLSNDTIIFLANNGVFAKVVNNNISAGVINTQQAQKKNLSTSELVNQLITGLDTNGSALISKPNRLVVTVNNQTIQNDTINEDSPYSLYIINNNGTVMTYVMNKEMEDSVFTKLYILGGMGVTQFSLAYEQTGVLVWNVL